MMNDKATIYLTSLVGFGAVVLTLITTFLHTTLIGYMVILMLFCTALIILTLKGHFSHHIENLEKQINESNNNQSYLENRLRELNEIIRKNEIEF